MSPPPGDWSQKLSALADSRDLLAWRRPSHRQQQRPETIPEDSPNDAGEWRDSWDHQQWSGGTWWSAQEPTQDFVGYQSDAEYHTDAWNDSDDKRAAAWRGKKQAPEAR